MEQIELVMWEDIRRDCKYPIEDNNNGYIYGVNMLDGEDIMDVMWFQTEDDREKFLTTERNTN